MSRALTEKLKKIKFLICDVDGVLTNGTINYDPKGNEIKVFNVMDGFGIVLLHHAGFKTAVISARAAPAVITRCKDLKMARIYQDAKPKTKAFDQICKDFKLKANEICFIGDDLPDLCLINKAGVGVAVANAAIECKRAANYVTKKQGGQGAVREVVELILKAQGKWRKIVESYK